MNIQDEQPGYQKRKSTLPQILTIRLLIMLAKVTNETFYIGCVDIQKAFDKVPRLLMLEKLKYGIGYCRLHALKAMYCYTSCILTRKSSRQFQTYCGIRQSAASSSLLFILFIEFIRQRQKLHTLISIT